MEDVTKFRDKGNKKFRETIIQLSVYTDVKVLEGDYYNPRGEAKRTRTGRRENLGFFLNRCAKHRRP